jgi:hypothetical protein
MTGLSGFWSHKIQYGFRSQRSTFDHLVKLEPFIRDTFLNYNEHALSIFFNLETPVRIWVRIDPPPPHVCERRLIGAVLRMRPEKPRSRFTAGVAR